MSTDIEKYQYELLKYNTLKKNISELVSLLENASNSYSEINKSLSNIYLIDNDNTEVYKKSIEIKDKIDDTSKKLKDVILSKIDSKIYSLKNDINDCKETE